MATAVLQPTPAQPSAVEQSAPLAPQTLEETGLTSAFVADLTLKLLYQKGQTSAGELADTLCLPLPKILQATLDFLKNEHFVEVKGGSGVAAATYVYVISENSGSVGGLISILY